MFTIPPPKALFAKVEAWLNLSHREKATVFVIVRIRAIPASVKLVQNISNNRPLYARFILPTRLSQITLTSLTIAKTAKPTHRAGVTYRLNQKNRLSVAVIVRTLGSEDSKTQCESPEVVLTSFHHRSPTSRRPAMFFR